MYTKRLARLFVSAASALLFALLLNVMISYSQPTADLAQTDFAGGSGTESDSHFVVTAAHLDNAKSLLGAHFWQVADVNLGVQSALPVQIESPSTTRVSIASDGAQGNGFSGAAAISADGRYVAFWSEATNLVPGDTNAREDIFVHDQVTSATTRVSIASDGAQANSAALWPSISANGRYVAFYSGASNLVPGDTNGAADIFVHDRDTATTSRVSVASDGTQANGGSGYFPLISADGRYVAFESDASNLVPGDTNGTTDIFVHDRETGATSRVSVASNGDQANAWSSQPSISTNGRYVTFWSYASNLVPGDTNGTVDVFVHDRETGATTRVSVASDGAQANGHSNSPSSISANGRYVVFHSEASNLVPGDTNGLTDIFVHDRETGATTRVSVASNGAEANHESRQPSISTDGRYVAFRSYASNLVPGDTNGTADIFVHDRVTGATTRVSVANDGNQANDASTWPSVSADGRFVAFGSYASNLVPGDTNGTADVFLRQWIPESPAPFSKTAPANGATAVSLSPTLTWETSSGADSYEYCLGSSSGTCDLLDWTDAGGNTSVALSDLTAATTYHWQVRAINTGGTTYANDDAWWSFITTSPADDFVIEVKTDNEGTSSDTQFTIPTTGIGYNYNVDCNNDGVDDATSVSGAYTCNYNAAGTYTIRIKDNSGAGTGFPRIYFNNGGDRLKLLEIQQWGTGKWTSMAGAFYGCANMTMTASDAPDLSGVTDISSMFAGASAFDGEIGGWDTGNVIDMEGVFFNASAFNQDIGGWDTGSVTNMRRMFYGASAFNQGIGGWNTGNVTRMDSMFFRASAFNQDISGWDTGNVTDMGSMFYDASAFNQDIGGWDTGNVTNMAQMFSRASAFNQDIGGWDTGNVINMSSMFSDASVFNQDIDGWDTSNVTQMGWMFRNASAFNQNIGGWDTGNVTYMAYMFLNAGAFNGDIGDWDTGNVTYMSWMFDGASAFNQDISGWNTGNVIHMERMFRGASVFNQGIGNWDTGNVADTGSMFEGASAFNQDIGGWDVTALTNATNMFLNAGLSTANYDALLIGWSAQILQSGVEFHAGNSTYCAGEAARAHIISNYSWTITDGGKVCPPPAAFGKSTPANGTTGVSLSPTLTWETSAGADSYEYCLGSASGVCDLLDWTNVGENTSVALSDLNTATAYHWQARAVNAGGATYADDGTSWSFTTVPDAPAAFGKTAPADGAMNVSLSPTLTWESSAGADSYEYCLGSASGVCDLFDWENVGENTSVALSDLETATTYHWQTRAANPGGATEADSGVWWSFTTFLPGDPVTNVILRRQPLGEVLVGNPARFAVMADGARPFTYTWSLNGDVVGENRYIYEQLFTAAGTYTVGVTVANILNAVYAETLVTVVEPVTGLPDLSFSDKLASLSFVESGDTLTYTLLLRNTAGIAASATLTDPIPAYTTYLPGSASASDGGDVVLIDDAIVWHGEIISGTPVLIQFAVTVGDAPIGAQIVNNAALADGLGNLLELVSSATFNPGYRLTISDGALATSVPTVTLRYGWNAADAITHVQFSNDGGFGAGSSAWLPVNPTDPTLADWVLDIYGDFRMPYFVFARFRNAEGQTYGPVMDWIIYDPVAPRISSVEIIPGTGPVQAFSSGVIVRIMASDGNTGVARVQLSHTEDFASYEEVRVTGPTTDVPWALGSGGKVYARAVDRAGNISAPVSAGTEQHYIFLPFVIRANPPNGQANVDQDSLMDQSGGGEAAAWPAASNWLAMQPEEVYMPRRD